MLITGLLTGLLTGEEHVETKRRILVTTAHRGVFFGTLDAGQTGDEKSLTLLNCRNAIYWTGKRGFLGLASHGPDIGSRIGAAAPRVLLHDITSVADCTDSAAQVWEAWKGEK